MLTSCWSPIPGLEGECGSLGHLHVFSFAWINPGDIWAACLHIMLRTRLWTPSQARIISPISTSPLASLTMTPLAVCSTSSTEAPVLMNDLSGNPSYRICRNWRLSSGKKPIPWLRKTLVQFHTPWFFRIHALPLTAFLSSFSFFIIWREDGQDEIPNIENK